jgi:alkyl sulfatase BDS1-like metallo-beta-lactamase superfamily hydrolase
MRDRKQLQGLLPLKPVFVLLLWCLAGGSAWPQTNTSGGAQSSNTTCPSPVPPPQIAADPLLVGHTNFFCPVKVYDLKNDPSSKGSFPARLNYTVYSAVGFDVANSMMLVGPDGAVIVDTLGEKESAQAAIQQFKSITRTSGALPVKAIIYTHSHIDHIGGVQEFLNESGMKPCPPQDPAKVQDGTYTARTGCVEVLGQANIVEGLTQTATLSGAVINPRSAYMYGIYIGPRNGANRVNVGIGPQVNPGTSTFRLPSRMFNQQLEVTVAGMTLELIYVPSETNDELMVFVPDNKNGGSGDGGLLFSAEVIQGPSFPNLYSLRGTSYRSPATWYKSVDTLRNFNSWCMVPSHGVPLCGADNVQTLLVNFRDAVQFTHDQTVRFMDQGFTPDELVGKVILPDYLIKNLLSLKPAMPAPNMDPQDYLREFYGSVRQSVREIYFGYIGWFPGDPVDLNPTPPVETAAGYIALIGKDKLEQESQSALARGQYQWAAELATLLIRVDHEDFAARKVKADAFRQLATTVTNPNWRNWYITAADELCFQPSASGACRPFPHPPIPGGLISPGIVAALPPDKWVSSWTIWLQPDNTTKASLGFLFPDEGPGFPKEQYVLQRDKAVVRFITTDSKEFAAAWSGASVQVSITRPNLLTLLTSEAQLINQRNPTAFTTALQNGCYENGQSPKLVEVTKGDCPGLKRFTDMFQQPLTQSPQLTIR